MEHTVSCPWLHRNISLTTINDIAHGSCDLNRESQGRQDMDGLILVQFTAYKPLKALSFG